MIELCQRVQMESDPKKFTQLVYELNVLLEACQFDLNPTSTEKN
jgi:hypothetical protein